MHAEKSPHGTPTRETYDVITVAGPLTAGPLTTLGKCVLLTTGLTGGER
jgi:hypothetical protein